MRTRYVYVGGKYKMTLVEEISRILKVEDYSGINKDEAIKNTIEHYRKEGFPLLEEAIQSPKEETFQNVYKQLLDNYEGVKTFFLPRLLKKYETKAAKENKELIDPKGLDSNFFALSTPLTWGATPAALFGILGGPLIFTIGLGIVGFTYGFIPVSLRCGYKETLKENLKTLDDQIEATYHQK